MDTSVSGWWRGAGAPAGSLPAPIHRHPAIVSDCMVLAINYSLWEAACKNKIK